MVRLPGTIMSVLFLACAVCIGYAQQADGEPLLEMMQREMQRSVEGLRGQEYSPYFISYYVNERQEINLAASYGALRRDGEAHTRRLDVDVRVGDYAMDNSRKLKGMFDVSFLPQTAAFLPLENNADAIRSILWKETDKKFKAAIEKYINVKTNESVKVASEDQAGDFSREKPRRFSGELPAFTLDTKAWQHRLVKYSTYFNDFPEIYQSSVELSVRRENRYIVTSEGTQIQEGTSLLRIFILARARAEDGMELFKYRTFDAHTPEKLPNDADIQKALETIAHSLLALRDAPAIEPYTGPAILSGRAAAVFFHEIFGHRIEGHRQKDEFSGQTFTKKVNEQVLPEFLSVYDDPTKAEAAGVDLRGYYRFDDEGVEARRVEVVKNGILKNFLMSRTPVEGFLQSNGHGRKAPGRDAVGRQGNLIVEASETVTEERMRAMLIEECRAQGKPFGLLFTDIAGGFTYTGRGFPNSFAIQPVEVFKVYTDGRPDELVRGADIIGTPLASFAKIIAASDRTEVFNGTCGAESGWVPVSGIAPGILTSEIEIQKKFKAADRQPILAKPTSESQ